MSKTAVIILAAGHGKRMQSELPKALVPLHGKPLIEHVLSAVASSGLSSDPIIVVGKKREAVMEALGEGYRYAIQEEQLGTGNAVLSAESQIAPTADSVLVLYVDQPFITPLTINTLANLREETGARIAMATVTLPDFASWRSAFLGFSRVIRKDGKIVGVIESKDASEEDKKILEVNPAYFCFDRRWLFDSLKKIGNNNAQGEYYLTDLVKLAFLEGLDIPSILIEAKEAIGTNSKEDIESAESI
jgi:bifunctional UDP-N-acetylglucosamine pyrophosphorylase/glucosamine-1-phosphate N-acetyltransferase